MADALTIVLEMIWHIISTTIQSVKFLSEMFQKLLAALAPAYIAGPGGSLLAGVVLFLVAYFCIKFIFRSGKEIIVMLIIGIVIVVLLLAGRFLA